MVCRRGLVDIWPFFILSVAWTTALESGQTKVGFLQVVLCGIEGCYQGGGPFEFFDPFGLELGCGLVEGIHEGCQVGQRW